MRFLPCKQSEVPQKGLTLIELIVAFSILLILSTLALPLARMQIKRER